MIPHTKSTRPRPTVAIREDFRKSLTTVELGLPVSTLLPHFLRVFPRDFPHACTFYGIFKSVILCNCDLS
eukprot:SAG11_NODE_33136_length_279_cov_0.572222_1_plen_69_part_10